MLKRLYANVFLSLYMVGLILFSFNFFFNWGLMVSALFLIFWTFRLTGQEQFLGDRERRFYLLTMLIYPIAETTVQWFNFYTGFMSKGFGWVNRVEHSCWAMVLTLLFLPLIAQIWQRLTRWQNFLFVMGFVCLLGNLNEFFEYYFRIQPAPLNQAQFSQFYIDTIWDMIMNLIGGLVGFLLLTYLNPGATTYHQIYQKRLRDVTTDAA